jgi:transglutaminase-like putative cysteine protease
VTHTVAFPDDRQVRLAGACLGRSLARSHYLRLRGVPHRVVIGVTGGAREFRAHAWIAPYEAAPDGFVELRSIDR